MRFCMWALCVDHQKELERHMIITCLLTHLWPTLSVKHCVKKEVRLCDLLWSVFCECKTFHSFLRLSANCNKAKTQKPPSPHFFLFVFAQIPLGEATMIYEFEPHSTFPLEQDLQPSVWTVTGFVVLPLYTGSLNRTTWVSFEVQTFSSKPNWQTLSCLKVQEMDRCLCCSSLL